MHDNSGRLTTAVTGALLAAASWLLAGHTPAGTAGNDGVQGAEREPSVVSVTEHFELISDPEVCLHHLLIAWSSADADRWPSFAPPIVERDGWRTLLSEEEAGVWTAAVEAYGPFRGRSLLFDPGLIAVRDWAAGSSAPQVPEPYRPMVEAIESALPVYHRHWWPGHDVANRVWIEAVAPELSEIEKAVARRLEIAYGGRWPEQPIPVDVVAYANPVGAYSTGGRVVISSVDPSNQMPQGLEIVFHEASHVDSLEAPLRAGITQAFRNVGGHAPDRFWHDMIFYTSGEVVGLALTGRGEPEYRHYGEVAGVYARGQRWSTELPALERHWRPFLSSPSADDPGRRSALEAVARELTAASSND